MKNRFIGEIGENKVNARIPNLAHYFILIIKKLFNFKQPLNAYQAKRGRLKLYRLGILPYQQFTRL